MIDAMQAEYAGMDHAEVYSLALETSSPIGSVALGRGCELIEARELAEPQQHAQQFIPLCAKLCADHGVTVASMGWVHVSIGPGSFTGLRVGVMVARMLGLAEGRKLVSVPTLEVIAQNALGVSNPTDHVMVMLDAKRSRVFASSFDRHGDRYVAVDQPVEVDPFAYWQSRQHLGDSWSILGDGLRLHGEKLAEEGAELLMEPLNQPHAKTVFALGVQLAQQGEFTPRRALVPHYVRKPDAEEKWEQQLL